MVSTSKTPLSEDVLESYQTIIAACPEVERKGKTMPYTSWNGHMFSFLSPEGILGLRLQQGDRKEFMEKFQTSLMEQHGRTMKEYVAVPAEVLKDREVIIAYFQKSLTYVQTLKPKPTRK